MDWPLPILIFLDCYDHSILDHHNTVKLGYTHPAGGEGFGGVNCYLSSKRISDVVNVYPVYPL